MKGQSLVPWFPRCSLRGRVFGRSACIASKCAGWKIFNV